jgi:hypothetical protein
MSASPDDTLSPALDQLLAVAESRLRELEPVVAEVSRLQAIVAVLKQPTPPANAHQIAALLSTEGVVSATEIVPASGRRARRGTQPGRDGRAPQGANKTLIMEAVRRHPGIRTSAVTEMTGLKRTVVSATVNRLKHQGELTTIDGGLHAVVPGGPTTASAVA